MSGLALALILCCCVVGQAASMTARMGILLPKNGTYCVQGAQYWITANKFAKDHIMNQHWWPKEWDLEFIQLQSDTPFEAWRNARDFVNNDTDGDVVPLAIIGPPQTDSTKFVQFVAEEKLFPVLSYSATGNSLSRYLGGSFGDLRDSGFFRVTYTDSLVAATLWSAISRFEFRKVSIIYEGSSYGRSLVESLENYEATSKVEIVASQGFHPNSTESIREALKDIKSKIARIVILLSFGETAAMVLEEAHNRGMYGKGWNWMGTDWVSSSLGNIPFRALKTRNDPVAKNEERREKIRDVLNGAVGVLADNSNAHKLNEFTPDEFPIWDECKPLNKQPYHEGIKGDEVDSFVPYVFDAVLVGAYAAAQVDNESLGASPMEFRIKLMNRLNNMKTPFQSPVTGATIAFDSNNDQKNIHLRLVNVQSGGKETKTVANWELSQKLKTMNDVDWKQAGKWKNMKTIVWPGGSTDLPSDRVVVSTSTNAALLGSVLFGMVISLMIGVVLHKLHVHFIPESGVVILLGICMGFIIEAAAGNETARSAQFDENLFMLVLLPIIIFESGYALDKHPFFSQLLSILTFAIVGTLIVTTLTALGLWGVGQAGLSLKFSVEEAFTFSALICAVDPVAVLATFTVLRVDPRLNSLVYGEAVLNDAVAIVLFRTFSEFITEKATGASIGAAIGNFFGTLLGSVFIGIFFGMLSTFIFRFKSMLWPGGHPPGLLQTAIPLLLAYVSFALGEALELSGIVSSLFCGILMNHYMKKALTEEGRFLTARVFRLLAVLAESGVFFLIGMNIVIFSGMKEMTWDCVLL